MTPSCTTFRLTAVLLALALAAPALAKSTTRTRLLVAPSPSRAGQAVTLTAEVDGLGGGTPTGNVALADGTRPLGSAALAVAAARGAGQATQTAGDSHTCGLTKEGGVKCWGNNISAQLGDGTTINRRSPVAVSGLTSGVVAVAAGIAHTCALTSAGAVRCWGDNAFGQLGDNTTTGRRTPVAVSGLASGVVAIAAGGHQTCALTGAGAVKCWGRNGNGQLGDGTTTNRRTPVAVLGLASGVVAIAVGAAHTCALTNAGAARCWGFNFYGQLGDGAGTDRSTPVAVSGLASGVVAITAGGRHTCALTSAGAARCWGNNLFGQIGDNTTTNRFTPVAVFGLTSGVVAIAGDLSHTCALNNAGAVKCWGFNFYGQLGDGTQVQRLAPATVVGATIGNVAATVGGGHSCLRTGGGLVRCWGRNGLGQIGDGTFTDRLTPVTTTGFLGLVRTRARLATSSLAVGTRALRATYAGSALHTGSFGVRGHIVRP